MMDLLAICLTGCMTNVDKVTCKRVNSLSPFGPLVMQEQGVGLTLRAFEEGVRNEEIAGHVGFAESIGMISKALGWKLDYFDQQMEPILTNVDRKSPYGFAKKGNVAGVNMTGQGYVEGKVKIDMIHPQQIEPELGGTHTGDYITLEGTPPVRMQIQPEVDGGIGTIAMCVNMIPHVINARPGLKTMIDLPVPHAIMGDMRGQIEEGLLDNKHGEVVQWKQRRLGTNSQRDFAADERAAAVRRTRNKCAGAMDKGLLTGGRRAGEEARSSPAPDDSFRVRSWMKRRIIRIALAILCGVQQAGDEAFRFLFGGHCE